MGVGRVYKAGLFSRVPAVLPKKPAGFLAFPFSAPPLGVPAKALSPPSPILLLPFLLLPLSSPLSECQPGGTRPRVEPTAVAQNVLFLKEAGFAPDLKRTLQSRPQETPLSSPAAVSVLCVPRRFLICVCATSVFCRCMCANVREGRRNGFLVNTSQDLGFFLYLVS